MKLHLLHGPAKAASRKRLTQIKENFDKNNIVVFEEGENLQTILGGLSTPSLFADDRLIILENPPEDFINYPQESNVSVILWFDHEISPKKPVLGWAQKSKAEILNFSEGKEVSVFPFLDYLAEKDKKAFLELQKLKIAGFDIQYFITMVFYLLRNLVTTPKNAPQFVKEKLQRQRKNFDLKTIKNLYRQVLDLDFKIKKGLLDKDQAEFELILKFIRRQDL